jgi:hypothetical protein
MPVIASIHSDDATSKTFFSFLPQYSTGSPIHISAYRRRMHDKVDGKGGCFQAVAFGGRTNSSADFARFFFPSWKTSVVIAEGPSPEDTDGGGFFIGGADRFKGDNYDLLARNFDIVTESRNFKSSIFILPEQFFLGVAFNYRQSFFTHEKGGYWFDITAPVMNISNDIQLNEIDRDGTALPGKPATMIDALNQADWKYGKFSPDALKETGVADIEVRLGAESIKTHRYYYSSFVGAIIPTGNKPKARYIFEPIVGRKHHWGLMWGNTISLQLTRGENLTVYTNLDINSSYLFENDEMRSFDLKDKQWSRYIPVFTDSSATTTSPGINVFTQRMKIRPRGMFQINSALTFNYKSFTLEGGMHSCFRQSEEGKLSCAWEEGPAIAGVTAATGGMDAESMNLANMRMWNYQVIFQDVDYSTLNIDPTQDTPLYKPLKEEDLDIKSALHPSAIAATLYAVLSYEWDSNEYPSFIGAGGSYQVASDNTASQRWAAWCKIGLSI